MTFEELLEAYEDKLEWVVIQKKRKYFDQDYLKGYYYGLRQMFHDCKSLIDFKPQIDKPTPEEKEKYNTENEVVGVLHYRGVKAPIYCDDYGQQEYIIYEGKTYSGGSYNFMAAWDFCDYLDDVLDEKILDFSK